MCVPSPAVLVQSYADDANAPSAGYPRPCTANAPLPRLCSDPIAAANNNDNNPFLPEEAFSTDSSRLSLAGVEGRR
ncbi:hypothetical protein KC361_g225 [Hortaea werneckii]|nr:hypothetical protein KC361_g225 [Hortaea werneckii]